MSIETRLEKFAAGVPTGLGPQWARGNRSTKARRARKGRGRPRHRTLHWEVLEERATPTTASSTIVTSSPDPSTFGQTVTFTATVKTALGGTVRAGSVNFSVGGTSSGPEALSSDGNATFTDSALSPGEYAVSATYSGTDIFDSSTGTESGGQTVDEAPAITSAAGATFVTGTAGSFTVTATGFPVPTLSESSGTSLASLGLSFNASTGVLSGTPAPNTGGTYGLIFSASNGVGPSATQDFSLAIRQPPAITSADNTTFVDGESGTFTVTASGTPPPSLSESGTLPTGVTFNASTGVLSGTPAATDPGGVYTVSVTASNGVGSQAKQTFFLVVNQPPAFTSADNATFLGGSASTFTVTATGSPVPTLSESGTLPSGVSFDPSTGILGGTPAATDPGGVYTVSFTASNGIGSGVTQTFFLVINQPPAITSANDATFVEGESEDFTVTATGSPVPTLSESGTLPDGVTFDSSTGALSGTPAADAGGTYPLTFTASNGLEPNATQSFTLSVVPANQVLIAPTDFVVTSVTASSIGFSWTDNDPTAAGYDVEEAVGGSSNFAPLAGSPFGPGTTSASATGLASGTIYQFEVSAVNSAGSSTWLVSSEIETLLTTTTSVSADPNPLVLTQTSTNAVDTTNDITLTATVANTSGTSDVPVGQVDFQDMSTGTDLGTVPLTDGSASLYVTNFDVGNHTIVASYMPDPTSLFGASSGGMTESVDAATAVDVVTSRDPAILGQPLTVAATVSNQFDEGGTPTGTVQFAVDGANFGQPVALNENGDATISDSSLAVGNHDISATYLPMGTFTPSEGDTTVAVDMADFWTGNAGDNNWDTPGNWSGGVPQSNEDAYINNLPAGAVIALGPADVAGNLTISSPLTLTATLTAGQLTVHGAFMDSAPLTLSGGVKLVALQSSLQDVTIMPGSHLSAQGNIQGNLVNDGMLDMGNSVGAVVVTGNYTQSSAGVLSVKIGGAIANQMDQLSVLGIAKLDGTLNATLINGFAPAPNQNLQILELDHPMTGGFANINGSSNSGVVSLQPVGDPSGFGLQNSPPGVSVSVTPPTDTQWQPEGPLEIESAQSQAYPDNGEEGAIASVLVTPSGTVYVGAVNGGVWSSNQLTPSWVALEQNEHPFEPPGFWTPLTDSEPSLAVSTMALDPNNPNNTLWVGTGSLSSYSNAGGPAVGLLETTDGGSTWTTLAGTPGTSITGATDAIPIVITTTSTANLLDGSALTISGVNGNTAANGTWTIGNVTPTSFTLTGSIGSGKFTSSPNAAWASSIYGDTVLSLVPTGTTDPTTGEEVVLVGTYGQGLWRSTDGGANFAPATFILNNGTTTTNLTPFTTLPASRGAMVPSIVADPNNPDDYYAAVSGVGIFESYNDGADWIEIDESIPQITSNTYYTLAAAPGANGDTVLYVATAAASNSVWGASYSGLLMGQVSPNALTPVTWIPVSVRPFSAPLGGSAVGSPGHFYLAVNPTNSSEVYIGGPVQLLATGLVSTNSGSPSGASVLWLNLSGGNGKPHDDQRDIAFLSDGTILATNDGGIYGLLAGGNHWVDLNENLQDTEFLSVAYDSQDGVIFGGSQDNGTEVQGAFGSWGLVGGVSYGGGDGGTVAVDNSGSQSKYYLFSDGEFETHSNTYNANIALAGLNSADQQTIANNNANPGDASFFVAVNPYGPAPGSTTGLAPILLGGGIEGLTGLYESFNGGATVTLVSAPTSTGNPSAFTYASAGGEAYYGTTSGQLFLRSGYGQPFTAMPTPNWGNAYATQIVADPGDGGDIYVLDDFGNIWGSFDQGAYGWTNLTSGTNLAALDTYGNVVNIGESQSNGGTTTTVQSIQVYDPTPYTVGDNIVLAGALGGVYALNVDLDAEQPSQYVWSQYGQGLPNVQVSDLDYVPSADLLIAGTFGRGAWEIAGVSNSIGTPDAVTIDASGGTILLRQDPTRAGYAQLLTDGAGATIAQVINDDNVDTEEQWAALGQITITADSETVDILNVPQGVSVTVDGGGGTNTVNLGSAANQLNSISGTVAVGTATFGSITSLNVNDQGDTSNGTWTIGGGSITESGSFPGSIDLEGITAVFLNAGTSTNSFTVNDTNGTAALTLNTGKASGNSVTVNDTSDASTLTINNQGPSSQTAIKGTFSGSPTYINDSFGDQITLGKSLNGVNGIEGPVNIKARISDTDTLFVNDSGDGASHTGADSVTVTGTSITGLARAAISYTPYSLSTLTLEGDGIPAVWNVQDTPIPYTYIKPVRIAGGVAYETVTSPTTTTIRCSAQDTVNVGDPSNGLQDIFGTLNIDAPAISGAVDVSLDDHETTYGTPQAVSVTTNSESGLGPAVINYGIAGPNGSVLTGGVSTLTTQAGTGGAAFTVGDMTGGPATVNLSALGTGNSLTGPNTSVSWTFQGHINGPLDSFSQGSNGSTVSFTGIGALTGGSGPNDFKFIQTGFTGSIDGGSSGDSTLDFRKYGGTSLSVETTQDGSLNGVQGNATEGTSFNDIDTILGDPAAAWEIGTTTAQNDAYQGDFTHKLTVVGFANPQFNFSGNFSGELLASTEGTAANPIQQINVSKTIESGAVIKVDFLFGLDVEGDMDGTVKAFGVSPSVASIQHVVIDGQVGVGGQLVARSLGTVEIQQGVAGTVSESEPTADFQSLTVVGAVLPGGLIYAPSGGTLSVGGDLSGEAVITGALGTLTVGGTLNGTVSAGSIGTEKVTGPVTGQVDTGQATAPPVDIAAGDVAGLIQAIDDANLIAEPSIINLAAGATYVLAAPDNDAGGPNGLPVISSTITINGNGAIIERTGATPFRIFSVAAGASLVLSDLTVEGGSSDSGGGIDNDGTLTLNGDVLTDNSATGNGGAVYNAGTFTPTNTTYSNNSAGGSGPDVFNAPAPTATTTSLTDNGPNPSTFGQPVNFTVDVTGGVPDGEQVTLKDADNDDAVVGTGMLAGGTASIAVTDLAGGTHDLFAVYGGDPNLLGSQSITAPQTVNQVPTFTSAAQATFTAGASNTFTVTAIGNPSPTLSESSSDVLPAGVTFNPSTGTLSGTPALGTVGTYTLSFTADDGIGDETSQTLSLVVGQATPVITWNTPSAIAYGTPLDSSDLDATANVPGAFVYAQAPGVVLPAVNTPPLTVTFTPTDTADYATVTQVVPIAVEPAPLSVYADPQTIIEGSPVPPLTFSATGLVNGDTPASLPGALATTATASSLIGTYDITLGTLGSVATSDNGNLSNYTITYHDAPLIITVAPTELVAAPPSPTYAGTSFNLTVTAEDGSGNTGQAFDAPVTIAIASGPTGASLGGTPTAPAQSGVASFSGLSLNLPGTYTLTLSGGGLSSTVGPFQVVVAPAPSVANAPALAPHSETGASGYTRDNGSAAAPLVFIVGGVAPANAFVQLYNDTNPASPTPLGIPVQAVDGAATITLAGGTSLPLADGTYTFAASAALSAGGTQSSLSPASSSLTVQTSLRVISITPSGAFYTSLPSEQVVVTFNHALAGLVADQANGSGFAADPFAVMLIPAGPSGLTTQQQTGVYWSGPSGVDSGNLPLPATAVYHVNADGTSTITLTPHQPLSTDIYLITVQGLSDLAGNAMANSSGVVGSVYNSFDYRPVNTTGPRVTSVTAEHGAVSIGNGSTVPLADLDTIAVAFDRPMDTYTINTSTVELLPQGSTTPVAAAVTYSPAAESAYLTPEVMLSSGKQYMLTVSAAATDDEGFPGPGVPLGVATNVTFTVTGAAPTGKSPLTVTATSPAGSTNWSEPLGYATVTFSEPLTLDAAHLGRFSAMVVPHTGGVTTGTSGYADVPYNATLAFNPNTNQLVLVFTAVPDAAASGVLHVFALSSIKATDHDLLQPPAGQTLPVYVSFETTTPAQPAVLTQPGSAQAAAVAPPAGAVFVGSTVLPSIPTGALTATIKLSRRLSLRAPEPAHGRRVPAGPLAFRRPRIFGIEVALGNGL